MIITSLVVSGVGGPVTFVAGSPGKVAVAGRLVTFTKKRGGYDRKLADGQLVMTVSAGETFAADVMDVSRLVYGLDAKTGEPFASNSEIYDVRMLLERMGLEGGAR